jgi:FkbM family methyltransferase
MLRTIKRLIKSIVFSVVKPPPEKNCFSQAGEDVIVKFLFDSKKVLKPSYLELGVFLPEVHNNTFLFYQSGSRGVLVDADNTYAERIKKVRPHDKFINVGVGTERSEADFYVFKDRALSTFDKKEALHRDSIGTHRIVETRKIQLLTVNELIESNFQATPYFLSVDLEGFDLTVLQSLDYRRFPVPVICVETCTYSENHIKPKDPRIAEFMISKGYFIYADTYINTIFVNKEWFYSEKT